MRKENIKRSFWKMTEKCWGISDKSWLGIIRPVAIWTAMYFIISYFSDSFTCKSIYLTALAVIIISIVVFCFYFVWHTPVEIYNELQQKIEDLEKTLERQKLLSELEHILNKHPDFHPTMAPYPMISNEHPAYQEILNLLNDNGLILPKIISCFKEGKMPPHLKHTKFAIHSLDTRWAIIESIRNCDEANFIQLFER